MLKQLFLKCLYTYQRSGRWIRTTDLRIFSPTLYQLSYTASTERMGRLEHPDPQILSLMLYQLSYIRLPENIMYYLFIKNMDYMH